MAVSSEFPPRFPGHEYPQVIPVPDQIRAGGPSPWNGISETERIGISISHVEERLIAVGQDLQRHPIPGDPLEMAAVADAKRQPITRRSAVLAALFEEDGETHVVLTRRSMNLRNHRGEIALPGGRSDEGETPIETALREASEELGIAPSTVTPIAWLRPIVTFASGSAIWPIVGTLPGRPEMTTDPFEVDRAFTVPLRDLLAPGNFLEELWRREEVRPGADDEGFFPIYFFRVPGDLIWGATARILTELLCVVTDTPWPDRDRVWA